MAAIAKNYNSGCHVSTVQDTYLQVNNNREFEV